MVKFRVGLEAVAAKAGVEVKNDSSDPDIMKAVIVAKKPNAKLDGKDAGYIQARYDGVVEEMAVDTERNDDAANRSVQGEIRNDSADARVIDIEKSKATYKDSLKNAYKNKE